MVRANQGTTTDGLRLSLSLSSPLFTLGFDEQSYSGMHRGGGVAVGAPVTVTVVVVVVVAWPETMVVIATSPTVASEGQ